MTFLTASGLPASMFNAFSEGLKRMGQFQESDLNSRVFDPAVEYAKMLITNSKTRDRRCQATLLLATALLGRFACQGCTSPLDVDRAIECYKSALLDFPPGHRSLSNVHYQLVVAYNIRSSYFTDGSDREGMDLVVDHCTAALELCKPGQPDHACITMTLTNELQKRFVTYGDVDDLHRSIKLCQEALVCPAAGQSHYRLLENLARSLFSRFKQKGNQSDLGAAIHHHESALGTLPNGHPDRPEALKSVGDTYMARYAYSGELTDLQIAIRHLRSALTATTPKHSSRPSVLASLSDALLRRSKFSDHRSDQERAINHLNEALALLPCEKADARFRTCLQLADALAARFLRDNDPGLESLALEKYQLAERICPRNDPKMLLDLAAALCRRSRDIGNAGALDSAIRYIDVAFEMLPANSTYRQEAVINLGAALSHRYQEKGDQEDLDRSISLYEQALKRHPSHSQNHCLLANLATSLIIRFTDFGQLSDLDGGIESFFAAHETSPANYPDRDILLSGLTNALVTRYTYQGSPVDVDLAINCSRRCVEDIQSSPLPHLHLMMSHAYALLSRFSILEQMEDLDHAIVILEKLNGHTATFEDHYRRLALRIALADALVTQFNAVGGPELLDRAIDGYRKSIAMVDPQHPQRSHILVHSARAFLLRYQVRQALTDLDSAFEHLHIARDTARPGQQNYVYEHLIWAQHECWELSRDSQDFHLLFEYSERAIAGSNGGSWPLLKASLRWAWNAHISNHPSALTAYKASLNLLDRHALVAPSLAQRHQVVKATLRAPTLAADAASWAIRHGKLELAVEFLEQGRGLLWAQFAQLRQPLDHLRSLGENGLQLAEKFERLSRQLQAYSIQPFDSSRPSISSESTRYRRVSDEWTLVVDAIRQLDGFESFLRPTAFEELRKAAREGPVIILNASQFSCDAIIVFESKQPVHVPLSLSLADVIQISARLNFIMQPTTSGHGEDSSLTDNNLVPLLRKMWNDIVHPVVEALVSQNDPLPIDSRIWWCPTSKATFLPLHAAGPYRKGQNNLSHLFVSSYTPTLGALTRSRRSRLQCTTGTPNFLTIGQANPHEGTDEAELTYVDDEVALVDSLVSSHTGMPHKTLSGASATAENALSSLASHSWVHLASHGKQDFSAPFNSSFAMRGHPLLLKDIISTHHDHHEFAFLSACHTAAGDQGTPDEAIHLAAGMQFSGFRSVVGTMWAVDDGSAVEMVSAFYEQMFEEGVDYKNAARALNRAAKRVDKRKVRLDQRIVFIHIGA
ncbi:hypothetical protein HYDPIDRAFT_110483 [Hydnomerulius pinastri MD-312]|nr:hypothetical protein HYDPIDRAFT_110483 [Hydnomerulius pinastri MD-312]